VVKDAYEKSAKAGKLQFKNNFYLERGPYDLIAVMDENADSRPYVVKGPVIDLFDPELPVLREKTVLPGTEALLYDLSRIKNRKQPRVLASAARIDKEVTTKNSYSFVAKSPLNTTNSMRVFLPVKFKRIDVKNAKAQELLNVKSSWDEGSNTCWLCFENSPEGIDVTISF
jgi:hypothetical protein